MPTLDNVFKTVRLAGRESSPNDVVFSDPPAEYLHAVKRLLKNYTYLRARRTLYPAAGSFSPPIDLVAFPTAPRTLEERFEEALTVYKALCQESTSPEALRRWRALQLRYLTDSRASIQLTAKRLHVDQRTLYRDIHRAVRDIAVLVYGVTASEASEKERAPANEVIEYEEWLIGEGD